MTTMKAATPLKPSRYAVGCNGAGSDLFTLRIVVCRKLGTMSGMICTAKERRCFLTRVGIIRNDVDVGDVEPSNSGLIKAFSSYVSSK